MKDKLAVATAITIAIALAIALGFTACTTGTSPTAVATTGTATAGGLNIAAGTPTTPVTPVTPTTGDIKCDVWVEHGRYHAKCYNGRTQTVTIYAVVYAGGGTQRLFDVDRKAIEPGHRGAAEARLPDCGRAQGDTLADHEPPPTYTWPDKLPGMITGTGKVLNLGECPPPPPDDCTLTCPPPQILDPEECECLPPPPPPPCEPTGEPKCPEQVWDEALCEWAGKCPCEPVGKPDCPEQTWHDKKCKWVGKCPCVEQSCGFGYEWDDAKCKCKPMPLCHVSNKGKDGNWNIQETQTKFTPGHAAHLDPNRFCPPDYLGECQGLYDTEPHPCMGVVQ